MGNFSQTLLYKRKRLLVSDTLPSTTTHNEAIITTQCGSKGCNYSVVGGQTAEWPHYPSQFRR